MRLFHTFIAIFLSSSICANFRCAVAIGYPPFQYVEGSVAQGIDVEIANLFNKYNKEKVEIVSMKWDDAISHLHFKDTINCIWGMEITTKRKQRFLFTDSIYYRKSALFVRQDSEFKGLDSLSEKIIGDDLDSSISLKLRKNVNKVRLVKVKQKEDSFTHLKNGNYFAAIAPVRVGEYLSEKLKFKTKIVEIDNVGVPVAVATVQEDILLKIKSGLAKIPKSELEKVLK